MQKILMIGGIMVILVGGVGYGVVKMRSAVQSDSTAGPVPAVVSIDQTILVPSGHVTGNDSIQSLIALDKTLECSFRTDENGVVMSGTAFLSNRKLRVDTMYEGTSSVPDTASLIIQGDTLFTWATTKAGNFALQMPMSGVNEAPASAYRNGGVSLENKVQYDCKPWQVDGSVFAPPTKITFIDINDVQIVMPTIPVGMIKP